MINEGVLEISLQRIAASKDDQDYLKVNNFVSLFLLATEAKPLIKFDQVTKR